MDPIQEPMDPILEPGETDIEILGNTTDAKLFLRFNYCGGWGFRQHCIKAVDEIEKTELKGQLQYHLCVDPIKTGRNEVTLYTDEKCEGEGVLIHSKLKTMMQPCQHALIQFTFLKKLKEEVKLASWWKKWAEFTTNSDKFECGHGTWHALCDGISLNTRKDFLDISTACQNYRNPQSK